MTFKEALKKLHIEDYEERIFHSNSHGELIHLPDFILMAEAIAEEDGALFREWFLMMVEMAEKNWDRPESVFQHLLKLVQETGKAHGIV